MTTKLVDQIDAPKPANASSVRLAADEALVIAAKNGNEQAFEMLVKRHEQRILAVVRRYARVREDAEDIVQQSFQKAFIYLHRFEGRSSFSTWLVRIAINETLMLLRRGRVLHEVLMDESNDGEGPSSHVEIPDSSSNPETSYLQREEVRILSAAMHKLRPGLRKAMELRELAELSTEETAQRMGLSVGAVKARLFHGRRKLREVLRRYTRSPRMPAAITGDSRRVSRDRLTCSALG